jgi:hypothetical protein
MVNGYLETPNKPLTKVNTPAPLIMGVRIPPRFTHQQSYLPELFKEPTKTLKKHSPNHEFPK